MLVGVPPQPLAPLFPGISRIESHSNCVDHHSVLWWRWIAVSTGYEQQMSAGH